MNNDYEHNLCEIDFIVQVMAERQQQIDRKLDVLKAQQVHNFICISST
jgi:hypothetical protein